MVILSKVTLGVAMEVRLNSLLLFLKALPNGETASALHLFNSLIKEHSKIFCS